ncbi:acyl-CoA dehydrogenase family protein [Catenulispora yoronensis]|uniref:Acyl-CoA dehydrogenase family protein n=1 Tax=Catenulispora yoronensis TaxID=450799 RepID=A0ABN2UZW0_9ACTN
MRFDPEQQELRRTVRTLLERAVGDDVWRLLADQVGAHSLAIPEEYGGAGFSVLETHVVLEELGAALAASGFLSTALAAQAILATDSTEAKSALLPGIAEGRTHATLAWSESGSWDAGMIQASAEQVGDSWVLSGTKEHVTDGAEADLFVVPARTATNDGSSGRRLGLLAVNASAAKVTSLETVDPNRPQATVRFDRSPAQVLSEDAADALERILDLAAVAISAEQLGGAQRAFDLTLAYAKQRVQFGRPIGSFQAVKHRLADLYTLLESARSASYAAAFAAATATAATATATADTDTDTDTELHTAASRAKACCSEAFTTITGEAIQLHGGIGITWEHPIHLYFKRAHSTAHLFGTPSWHRRRYAEAVGIRAA